MRWIGRLVALLLLVAALAGGAAWLFRDEIARRWGGRDATSAATEVSPETAEAAAAKLERLRADGEVARLSNAELGSLIRYRWSGWVPDVLREPSVVLSGDTMRLSGRVPAEVLPSIPELDAVRDFLPDTVRVEVAGGVGPLTPGRAAFDVRTVEVAGIPLPARFYPSVIERLGRGDEPGLAPTAVAFALPDGVAGARVENGHLILIP